MVFTTGNEITRMVRAYGIDRVVVETTDCGATYTVDILLGDDVESLRVYEVTDVDHAISLAQKLADRFNVELTLPSLVDEDMAFDMYYDIR